MFACMECGRKFRTAEAASRAANNGCPKCGGTDIDLDSDDERSIRDGAPPAGEQERLRKLAEERLPVKPLEYGFDPIIVR